MTSTRAANTVPAAVISMGKNFGQRFGGDEHGLVAGDVRLRGERVHLLRAADARDALHAEAGDPPRGELLHEVGAGERLQERQPSTVPSRSRSTSSSAGFCTFRTTSASRVARRHRARSVRRPSRRRRRGGRRPRRRRPRPAPRADLHQPGRGLGRERDAALAGGGFSGNRDLHGASLISGRAIANGRRREKAATGALAIAPRRRTKAAKSLDIRPRPR